MASFIFFGDFVSNNPKHIKFGEKLEKWAKADYLACNFEAPIETIGQVASPKSGPSLCQSADSPSCLEKLGFNIIQLANNHIMDYGRSGLEATQKAFRNSCLLGAGCGDGTYDITVIECDGLKYGFLSLVQHEFGALDCDSNEGAAGTAWINHPLVNMKVRESKSKCDYLIVLPHAGFENIDAPLPIWKQRYRELIDFGADAIIASHPHVPQGWEIYHGKPIYYSLGNFCFDKLSSPPGPYWNKSLAVKLVTSDDGCLTFEHQNIIYYNNVLDIDDSEEINKHNKYLSDLLQNEELYNYYLDGKLDAFWETYKLYILRGLGAISLGVSFKTLVHAGYGVIKGPDVPMLINNFQCETHSWAIQNILKRKMK